MKTKQVFIDRFVIPAKAKEEFIRRTNSNREFIKTLPGFIKDMACGHVDDRGDFILMTIAEWESQEALQEAKKAVQKIYKQKNFNPAEFMEKLGVAMERGVFTEIS